MDFTTVPMFIQLHTLQFNVNYLARDYLLMSLTLALKDFPSLVLLENQKHDLIIYIFFN